MIPERMLEFLCLQEIMKMITEEEKQKLLNGNDYTRIGNKTINYTELWSRRNKILTELIDPYVIDSTSKE